MRISGSFCLLLLLFTGTRSCAQEHSGIIDSFASTDASLCFKEIKRLHESGGLDKLLSTWSDFAVDYTYGNSYDFGKFDECLALSKTQYCLVQYHYKPASNHKVISVAPNKSFYNFGWRNINRRFAGALCLPESCTVEDIEDIMDMVFKDSDFMQANYYDQKSYCKKPASHFKLDAMANFSITFFALILTLVAFGTYFTKVKTPSTIMQYIQCFSLTRNYKSLMNLSADKSTISCMNGMKVIATACITYFHYFLLRMAFPFKDSSESYSIIYESLFYTLSMSFAVYIEPFFVMSGVLLGRSLRNGEKIDFWKMLLQRYMRLTPSVFVLILMLSISVTLVGSGEAPYLFPQTAIDNWYNYGYTTLLHLEVYTNPRNMCIPHSWFMAVNFQLGVLAPLVEIGLRMQKKVKRTLAYGFIALIGLGLRLYTFMSYESYFEGDITHASNSESDVMAATYYPSHLWILPFFSGIFLAQILDGDDESESEEKSMIFNENIKKIIMTLGLYSSIAFIVVFAFLYPSTKVLTTCYLTIFIVSTSFIIYACHNGYGGPINDFLSSKFWIPLSRMSLSIYLVSPGMQTYNVIMKKRPIEFEKDFDVIPDIAYDLLTALPAIILLHLCIEAPFTRVGKLMTRKK